MEYIEYPKALYLGGEMKIVANDADEEVARAAGYDDFSADQEKNPDAKPEAEAPEDPSQAPAAAIAPRAKPGPKPRVKPETEA